MFLGEYEHTLDEKGRVAIPARFRGALQDGLVLTRGTDKCLVIWTLESWRAISERVQDLSIWKADARRIQRLLFSGAVPTETDKLGRVLVPAFLREYAELKDQVVLVGLMNRIEIWSKEAWEAERAAAEEHAAELAEHLSDLGL